MIYYLLILLVLAFSAVPISAQELPTVPPHSSSTVPPNARYEIVQSYIAAKFTFRLDRVCGLISQLVKTQDGGTAWEFMPVERRPACATDGESHYQFFSSSLAARYTFLMNTDTGMTWILTTHTNPDETQACEWERFEGD
jgi:photosystem II stability/assembly factor-like uncharacterized protein